MARLKIEFHGVATTFPLQRETVTVGRSNRADISLPDPDLAPVHFRIDRKEGGFRLKDDGSGAGTRVNGRPVYASGLRHGDEIEAGGLRCLFLEEAEGEPAAEAPVPEAEAPRRKSGRSRLPLALGMGGGVAALVAVLVLLSTGPSEEDATALWREANASLARAEENPAGALESLGAARAALERIDPKSKVGRSAASTLAEVRRALAELAEVEEASRLLASPAAPAETDAALSRLAAKRAAAHPAVAARILQIEESWRSLRAERVRAAIGGAEAAAAAAIAAGRYGDALRVWRDLPQEDYEIQSRAKAGLAEAAEAALVAYRALRVLVEKAEGLDAKIDLLEASRPTFVGTDHAEDLEVQISSFRARRLEEAVVTLDEPKPKPPEREERPPKEPDAEPEPGPPKPWADPPEVKTLVRERRYGEAARLVHEGAKHPDAPTRVEELTLLAAAMADLRAAARARPADFTAVPLPHGVGKGDLLSADDRDVVVKTAKGETRYGWSSLPAAGFPRLFRIAGLKAEERLAVALFFDEERLEEEAAEAYAAFFKGGRDLPALQRVLRRRRGEEGPYELFRDRVVSPREREEILLREKVGKLAKQAVSSDPVARKQAYGELEALGEPAHAALADALRTRRAEAAEDLKGSKAFSQASAVAHLAPLLAERREEALKFILDPAKYPYPNKTQASQEEAERLVALVREAYETPYEILKGKSENARHIEEEIRDLDARIAKLDPDDQPLLPATIESIQRRLDMKRLPMDGKDRDRIEYNVAVESYNRALKGTSADEEERANVEAVNEYRWMMGLHAVKIDERLVRGARKHSIEMRQLGYFEHESPTPSLKTPGQRAKREGYGGGVGENIAQGPSNGKEAFDGWFHSSGHHRNMVTPGWTEMGCGQSNRHWWTQLFGALTGRSLDEPKWPPDPDPPGQSGNGQPPPD